VSEHEHSDPKPRNDTDVVQDLAQDLAEVAAQIATFKGEANAYLGDPSYNALRLRLETALAAV
jgi:DNA-binding transcriptional MerR regulator